MYWVGRKGFSVLVVLVLIIAVSAVPVLAPDEYHVSVSLNSPDPASNRQYGSSVAIDDGIVVVGEPKANLEGVGLTGKAYVYDGEGNLRSTLLASEPEVSANFGVSVAVSGEMIVVGECGDWYSRKNGGKVNVYDSDGSVLTTLQSPRPEEDICFGSYVAISDGIVVVADQWFAIGDDARVGKVYIFNSDGGLRAELQSPSPGAYKCFGRSVAVVGDLVVVGEVMLSGEGMPVGSSAVHIFDVDGNYVASLQHPEPEDSKSFGSSVAVGGGVVVVGDSWATVEGLGKAGGVYVFDYAGGLIKSIASPEPEENAEFGRSVSVGGGRILVGEYKADVEVLNEGKAHMYDLEGNHLETFQAPEAKVSANFGWSVSVSEDGFVVAEPSAEVDGSLKAGGAHVFMP